MVLDYKHTGNKRTVTQPIENWNGMGDAVEEAHTALIAADTRMDTIEATLATLGVIGFRNLVVIPGTTATVQVRCLADVLAVEGYIREVVDVTADITVVGKNGLDTGSRTTNTWYYLWAGFNPTSLEVCGLWSLQSTRAALTLSHASLSGFTKFKRVAARRTNATSGGQFLQGTQTDHIFTYDAGATATRAMSLSTGTGDTNFATLELGQLAAVANQFVPPIVRHVRMTAELLAGTGSAQLMVRPGSPLPVSTTGRLFAQVGTSVDAAVVHDWVVTSGTQSMQWAAGTNMQVALYVAGFYDPVG